MLTQLTTVLGLLAFTAQVVVATPPACLIAAVNTQDDPSDMKSVCTAGASQVQKYMGDNCGSNQSAANSAFEDFCKDAGVTVSSSSSSSSSTSDATSSTASASVSSVPNSDSSNSSNPSGTKQTITSSVSLPEGTGLALVTGTAASSGFVTATNGTWSASASASASRSAPASGSTSPSASTSGNTIQSTGAASRLGMDIVGLVAVGVFGAMLAV